MNTPSWTLYARPADLPAARPTAGRSSRAPRSCRGSAWPRSRSARRVQRVAVRARPDRPRGQPGCRPPDRGGGRSAARDQRRGRAEALVPRRDRGPAGRLLAHVVGTRPGLRAAEELSALGYQRDDVIGRDGVEASFEELRGTYRQRAPRGGCRRQAGEGARAPERPDPREEPDAHDRFPDPAHRDRDAQDGDWRLPAVAQGVTSS